MKIICDCGEILYFEIDKQVEDVEEDVNAYKNSDSNINIHAEHDECWIGCEKCKSSIHFYT